MSTQANPNSQTPQTGAPEQPQELPEIQKLYKDLTLYIRDTYFPHYNLYQPKRAMLQEKVRCYEAYNKEPDQYFVCIDKVEEAMRTNAQQIKRRFDIAEQVDNHCKTECKDLHTDKDQYVKCVAGCASSMKDACSSIYNQFYTKVIGDLPEYQKIKK